MEITLPVGVKTDIDECFCYMEDVTYQARAHAYLERYEVSRGYNDTAMHACVTDIAKRAFAAGMMGSGIEPSLDLKASLLETAAMLTRLASEMEA